MGRAKEPELTEQLLDACTDVALQHGLPDRLGPFVTGTGTSSRMLVYHFGTRDQLLRAVLRRARERQRALFGDLLRLRPDESYLDTLARAWTQITGDAGWPFLMMFTRLREDAAQQLWPGFPREATVDWLEPIQTGMDSLGRRDQASLVLAVVRGLVMDLQATHDTDRVDRAFTDFLRLLRTLGQARPDSRDATAAFVAEGLGRPPHRPRDRDTARTLP